MTKTSAQIRVPGKGQLDGDGFGRQPESNPPETEAGTIRMKAKHGWREGRKGEVLVKVRRA